MCFMIVMCEFDILFCAAQLVVDQRHEFHYDFHSASLRCQAVVAAAGGKLPPAKVYAEGNLMTPDIAF